jgi:hypothetical protein
VTTATVARTGLSIAPNFGSENLLKWLVETCERPCGRAADERDEIAPPHVRHGTLSQHRIGAADGPTWFSARSACRRRDGKSLRQT